MYSAAGWPTGRSSQDSLYQRGYNRVRDAAAMGYAGQVPRTGRGWVLTKAQVTKLMAHLRERLQLGHSTRTWQAEEGQ
jgi:hypothetical protein